MRWPFRRHKAPKPVQSEPEEPPQTKYDAEGNPVEIPLYNTEYEDVITGILERAQEQARNLEDGTYKFVVELTSEELASCNHPLELLGPLYMRARNYDLDVISSLDEKITFESLLRPRR